jgi:hypothetical protein
VEFSVASAVGSIVSTMLSFPISVGIPDTFDKLSPPIADGDNVLVNVGIADESVVLPTPITDGDPDKTSDGIEVSDGDLVGVLSDDAVEEAGDGIVVAIDSTSVTSPTISSSVSMSASLFVELDAASAYCSQ